MDFSIVLALTACMMAVLLRLLPRWIWPDDLGPDGHFHYFYIRMIAENGHRLPLQASRVIGGPIDNTYPGYYHRLLSYLPFRYLAVADKYSGLLFDVIGACCVAAALMRLDFVTVAPAGILVALYLIAPALTSSAIGPRAFSLTPRNFAHLMVTVATTALILAMALPSREALVVSAVAFAIVLLSSKFGTQYMLFVLPLAALFHWDGRPLMVLAGSFVAAALIGGPTRFIAQLQGHFFHLEWYYKTAQSFVAYRGNWSKLYRDLIHWNYRGIFDEIFIFNPILAGINRNVSTIISLVLVGMTTTPNSLTTSQTMAVAMVIAAMVPWMLTSFGAFRILGEAERYLEFSFAANWFLLGSLIEHNTIIYLLSVLFLIYYGFTLQIIRIQKRSTHSNDIEPLGDVVRAENNCVLLCLNTYESHYFLDRTQATVCGFSGNATLRQGHDVFFRWFFWRYPHVHPANLSEICCRYHVDLVINNKIAQQDLKKLSGLDYDFSDMTMIFDGPRYTIYRTSHQREG